MTWRACEAEWRISAGELYTVERAYGGDEEWSATYYGPGGEVEIEAYDHDNNAIWHDSEKAAKTACLHHRAHMLAGMTAEAAALEVAKLFAAEEREERAANAFDARQHVDGESLR